MTHYQDSFWINVFAPQEIIQFHVRVQKAGNDVSESSVVEHFRPLTLALFPRWEGAKL